jgi:hypothetical protein
MRQVGAWLAPLYPDLGVYLWVLEVNSAARRFYERLGAQNAGVSIMETHGGAVVRSCRYTWPRAALLSAGREVVLGGESDGDLDPFVRRVARGDTRPNKDASAADRWTAAERSGG